MENLLFVIAGLLVLGWTIGYFGFNTGEFMHSLLVVAVLAILLHGFTGKKSG